MNLIDVHITFLHNARPYISGGEIANTKISCLPGALPNKGDILKLPGITHPKGAFVVAYRVVEAHEDSPCDIAIGVGIEGEV